MLEFEWNPLKIRRLSCFPSRFKYVNVEKWYTSFHASYIALISLFIFHHFPFSLFTHFSLNVFYMCFCRSFFAFFFLYFLFHLAFLCMRYSKIINEIQTAKLRTPLNHQLLWFICIIIIIIIHFAFRIRCISKYVLDLLIHIQILFKLIIIIKSYPSHSSSSNKFSNWLKEINKKETNKQFVENVRGEFVKISTNAFNCSQYKRMK